MIALAVLAATILALAHDPDGGTNRDDEEDEEELALVVPAAQAPTS